MKALWQTISWHARQMLAEDPRVVVLSLLSLALGLGVHAGLLNSMIRSRLAHRARTAPTSMVVTDHAFAGAGDVVIAPGAVPSSDEAIAAFVRNLASKHNRTVECARTRRRSAHRMKSLKPAWSVRALPAAPALPADPPSSTWTFTVSPAAAAPDPPAAKSFVVITEPDIAPDVVFEPAAAPRIVDRGTPAGPSMGIEGPHSKPRCPESH